MRVIYEKRTDDFYCRDSRHRGLTLGYTAHLHLQIELAFVTAGKTRVWVDNHVYDLGAGDVIVIFPNQVHRFETVERELHISKYYISHIMSAKLHIGFNEYVNSLRVSNACKHLCRSDRSITEISELVGFNTPRTFNRAFYKQMGMTPREYRLQNMSAT